MNKNGCYYLNNSGSRWVRYVDGKKEKVKILPDIHNKLTESIIRSAIYYEMFGNFVSVCYMYKGKRQSTLNYKFI